jgi:hypothetical protein
MTVQDYTEKVERLLNEANIFTDVTCYYETEKDMIETNIIHNSHFIPINAGAVTRRIKLNTTPVCTAKGIAYNAIQEIFKQMEAEHV